MAIALNSKAPSAVVRYSWDAPELEGDSILSATVSVTSGTAVIDAFSLENDILFFTVSGGALGETSIISVSAQTADGETLPDTLYLPIRPTTNQFSYTVRDVCNYALRKIVGAGGSATSDEMSDATEELSDMLAGWASEGADLGVKLPCDPSDVLYAPDWSIDGIKQNLKVRVFDLYEQATGDITRLEARRGKARIKARLVPDEREGAEYY